MPKFMVERHIPGIGDKSERELETAASRFRLVGEQLGDGVVWIASFVTRDTMYDVFSAPDRDLIRLHGLRTGYPTDLITPIVKILEPPSRE